MKNQRECYKALLDGKVLTRNGNGPVHLVDGIIHGYNIETPVTFVNFEQPEEWSIYEPPKNKKTVELEAWFDGVELHWIIGNCDCVDNGWKRVSNEDKTIEIEE